MQQPALFLDRDGVLNTVVKRQACLSAPLTLEEFQIIQGAPKAVRRLKSAGYFIVVLTNQPNVARGDLAPAVLEQMHAVLRAAMPVDALYICPHEWAEGCDCKKPRPGMALCAVAEHHLDLTRSMVVGDRPADLNLAHALGIPGVLIRTEATSWNAASLEAPPAYEAADLSDAATWILSCEWLH